MRLINRTVINIIPDKEKQAYLRHLPAVDSLLKLDRIQRLTGQIPRPVVVEALQSVLNDCRRRIMSSTTQKDILAIKTDSASLEKEAVALALNNNTYSLRPVVNATGTVLHTNLGRAPLGPAAAARVAAIAGAYNNLELDLETGERGSRMAHLESLICSLTGAEGALLVNNNAAAVFLVLQTLATGKEVIVSRGELVEIGGSFRIPAVMRASGAKLVEVGTTNKTYEQDYEDAVTEDTTLFLKVHTSNYRIMGFTAEVSLKELVALGSRKGLPVVEDAGSGAMPDMAAMGLPPEPRIKDTLRDGVSLVTFSGDKLLGGPQAGIIAGKKELVEMCRKNQLMRVLRIDKMVIAAMEATLRLYREPERALREIPVLRMLGAGREEMAAAAGELFNSLQQVAGEKIKITPWEGVSAVGGGALPLTELPGRGVGVEVSGMSAAEVAYRLRTGMPPVVARVHKDRLIMDVRTMLSGDIEKITEAFRAF